MESRSFIWDLKVHNLKILGETFFSFFVQKLTQSTRMLNTIWTISLTIFSGSLYLFTNQEAHSTEGS